MEQASAMITGSPTGLQPQQTRTVAGSGLMAPGTMLSVGRSISMSARSHLDPAPQLPQLQPAQLPQLPLQQVQQQPVLTHAVLPGQLRGPSVSNSSHLYQHTPMQNMIVHVAIVGPWLLLNLRQNKIQFTGSLGHQISPG